ncbi:hypothetical protein [Chryseobacterium taklimakanense]|nr:hypothetical protein [Chryseobacterium taklimakanense]
MISVNPMLTQRKLLAKMNIANQNIINTFVKNHFGLKTYKTS